MLKMLGLVLKEFEFNQIEGIHKNTIKKKQFGELLE